MGDSGNKGKKVAKAVMVPLIISHDGAVHRDSVRRWKDFATDIQVDWVRMAQNVLRYNVVIVGRFFNKGSWTSEARKKEHPEECKEEPDGAPKELPPPKKEEREFTWNPLVRAPCVCAAFGHATATRGSVDVRWKGKPEPTGSGPINQHN